MTRKIIILLLFVIGIVFIAGGIWGLSLRQDSKVDPTLLGAAETVLTYADSALNTVNDAVADWTNDTINVTNLLNGLVGDAVDLTDESSLSRFAFLHAIELLLGGVVCIETALLARKSGR